MATDKYPRVLVDTDVFIDHLAGIRDIADIEGEIGFSSVTRCELFSWKDAEEDLIRKLLSAFIEIPVDREVAELAGSLRRKAKIKTPDALIAASALTYNCTLITRNTGDFKKIEGLRVKAP